MFEQMEYGRVPEEELSVSVHLVDAAESKYIMEGRAMRKTMGNSQLQRGQDSLLFPLWCACFRKPSSKVASVFYYHMQWGIRDTRNHPEIFQVPSGQQKLLFQRVCSRCIPYPGGSAGL